MLKTVASIFMLLPAVFGFNLNATGGTFPNQVYQEATFSYQFTNFEDVVTYFPLGSTTGKCNIMGYWQTANSNSFLSLSTKTRDTLICTDKCNSPSTIAICGNSSIIYPRFDKFIRKPLVDFAASDSVLGVADYVAFPDLQMFPAVAGAVVPIYNVPELQGYTLVLSRNSIALIYLGAIRYWNDPRIINDNTGYTKLILSTLAQPIRVVVRTDSSGTTEIFTTGIASFSPCCQTTPDNSFATIVGSGSAPKWCGAITDEIQILTIKNCSSTLSYSLKFVTLDFILSNYSVAAVTFACDISATDLKTKLNTLFAGGVGANNNNILVKRTPVNSTASTSTYVYTIGYWGASFKGKNWYQPYVQSYSSPVSVSIVTLQEGGFFNSHFNSSAYFVTSEIHSIYVNVASNGRFNISNPNKSSKQASANPVSTCYNIPTSAATLLTNMKSCLSTIAPYLIKSIAQTSYPGSNWVELRITFNASAPNPAKPSPFIIQSSSSTASPPVILTKLLSASNYPLFYNVSNLQGYSGSGQYTCYRHDMNMDPWTYDTGSGNKGVIAAVRYK